MGCEFLNHSRNRPSRAVLRYRAPLVDRAGPNCSALRQRQPDEGLHDVGDDDHTRRHGKIAHPSVSNDNPYSESLFKTLKYWPNYPVHPFVDIAAARTWVNTLVQWYNHEHRHSAIRFVTPGQRSCRFGCGDPRTAQRVVRSGKSKKSAALEPIHPQLAAHRNRLSESRSNQPERRCCNRIKIHREKGCSSKTIYATTSLTTSALDVSTFVGARKCRIGNQQTA